MSDDEARGNTRSSARLPATLLLIMIVAISGSVLWLVSEPTPEKPAPPTADVALSPVEPQEPAAATPPAPVPAVTSPQPAEVATPANVPAERMHEAPPAEKASPAPTEIATPAPEIPAADLPEAHPPAKTAVSDRADSSPPAVAPEKLVDASTVAPPVAPVIPKLPRVPRSLPLTQAPDPALVEESQLGPLPVVGRDGREPWRVYARPFDQEDTRPRIAVVIYGLGASAAATRSAIQGLPGAITLAFTPYADGLPRWMAATRAAGHEALLMVPMEPDNYPEFDPGPQALLTSLSDKEITVRLEWMLGRGIGYVGVTDFMGSRFTSSNRHMRLFLGNLKKRGLLYLESRKSAAAVNAELAASINLPFAANLLYIDSKASRAAIDNQLGEAERLARRLGKSVVMGFPYPVTLERVAEWASTVEKKGFALAPISSLAARKGP